MTIGPSRRGQVPPFIAMDVLRAATSREAAGASVHHLEVGQPGTPAPARVREAAHRALDEAYECRAAAARAESRQAIVINSFSKYYGMTGWRLGWTVTPPDLARSVECLAQNFNSAHD